jgi:imidazolonepropionase-like amidohydrolase
MKYYIITIAFLILFAFKLKAQNPAPAPQQNSPVLLKGGIIHIGNGTVINNGIITFESGKLTYVGPSNGFTNNAETYLEYDVTGQHIYPGLILCNSILGLSEIPAIKATNDYNETGNFNPNVRSIIAYNTDSERIPVNRSNGTLISQIVPQGGTVSGTSSVVQLDAWNWEDAVIRADEGIHFHWPNKYLPPNFWLGETEAKPNENYSKTIQTIEKNIQDAIAYSKTDQHEKSNLKLNALAGIFNGNSTLYLHVNKAAEIIKSVQMFQKYKVKKIVLIGATDAYYVREFIKENDIPLILNSTHELPSRPEEAVSGPYQLPFLLNKEGIIVAIHMSTAYRPNNWRNLPFLAGTAAAYGLSKEEALKLLTINPAKILGIENRVGTIEVEKDATIIVSDGDILDMMGNNVKLAFIEGRKIDLDNKHKRLYRKFKAKYE